MSRRVLFALAASLIVAACSSSTAPKRDEPEPVPAPAPAQVAAVASEHESAIIAWRESRVGNLRKPDGWLSLVGLHWLSEGEQSVGAAEDNDIVLATGPRRLGVIRVALGKVTFLPDGAARDLRVQSLQADAWVDAGAAADQGFRMQPDSGTVPGRVLIGTEASVTLIERGGKLALRVKDANAPTRTGFAGIDYYDIDPSWRIEADWTTHSTPHKFAIQTVIGTIEEMPNPGYASFSRDGRDYRLYPVLEEGSDEWFFIFADRTSGRETYGPGRFFYAAPAVDGGNIVLDFNKAYNPPCAFNEYSTCPLPPPENRLDLAVRAGEKKYRGH